MSFIDDTKTSKRRYKQRCCPLRKNKHPTFPPCLCSRPGPPSPHTAYKPTMPTDDYHTPGGSLKLKGSKPTGIKKKKKKPSSSNLSKGSALQKAQEEDAPISKPGAEDEEDAELRELEQRDPHDGKTAAERAAEDMRRKRVRYSFFPLLPPPPRYQPPRHFRTRALTSILVE
jgi:protein FAM32A